MAPSVKDICDSRIINKERVDRARQAGLCQSECQKLVDLFKAISDTTRMKILLALSREEMCVCDLAAYLDITESAVSHQLRMLRQLYLVDNRREGPILYYRLNDDHINKLIEIGLEHIRE